MVESKAFIYCSKPAAAWLQSLPEYRLFANLVLKKSKQIALPAGPFRDLSYYRCKLAKCLKAHSFNMSEIGKTAN